MASRDLLLLATVVVPMAACGLLLGAGVGWWPFATVISQITLTAAGVVFGPGPLVVRGILLGAALALGFMVGGWHQPQGGEGRWLTLWLTMAGTALALFFILRLAGLRLIDLHAPQADSSGEADAPSASSDSRGRQFSLAALFSATLVVALLAAVIRYAVPPHQAAVPSMLLLAAGWGLMGVTCILLVGLEGTFWMRAILAAMLIGFILADTWLLDRTFGPNFFLEICTGTLPILGGIALVIRCAGYSLDWAETDGSRN